MKVKFLTGAAAATPDESIVVSVSASQTGVILRDKDKTVANAYKWLISVKGDTSTKADYSEVAAVYKEITNNIDFTEFAVIGNGLNYTLDVQVVSDRVKLLIDNNEAEDLTVRIIEHLL